MEMSRAMEPQLSWCWAWELGWHPAEATTKKADTQGTRNTGSQARTPDRNSSQAAVL
jgi:hypothetical protein